MENKTKDLNIEDKKFKVFKKDMSLTVLLLFISGFLVFWFLISGSLTDNRFGPHLVMAADLTSIPMWYGLTIMYMAIVLCIGSIILFILDYRNIINLSAKHEKILRIGAMLIIAMTVFLITLSAATFAAFNSEFFLAKTYTYTSLSPVIGVLGGISSTANYSTQGMIFAFLTIGVIGFISSWAVYAFAINIDINDKMYFSTRNGLLFLTAMSWVIFNINVDAYGAMGGDLAVWLNNAILPAIGDGNMQFNNDTVGALIMGLNGGILTFLADQNYVAINIILGRLDIVFKFTKETWAVAQGILTQASQTIQMMPMIVIGQWIMDMDKPGMFQGTNDSSSAMQMWLLTLALIVVTPLYIGTHFKYSKTNLTSVMYDTSLYTILATTFLYGIMSWVFPYITVSGPWVGEEYSVILDGLINGNSNSLAPGVIGGAGQFGGFGAILIYFSPNYHGTALWWTVFIITILVPFISLGLAYLKYWMVNKGKEKVSFKEKTYSKGKIKS